jgi:Glycosyl hydrolase family 20, catalytic domain
MTRAKWKTLATFPLALLTACAGHRPPRVLVVRDAGWRAVHLLGYDTDADLEALGRDVPALAEEGVNVIILEVDYNFAFASHPELRRGEHPVSREGARRFAAVCRAHGVRLIPEFQSLGHQSWEGETFPLLTQHPELDLTPGAFPGNKGLYCREWDPLNPEVDRIVFDLIDEIVDAFEADALHVGMDEVFLLGSDLSPSTRGQDPAALFARVVNDLHGHLVDERHLQMLMWGDRLFDGKGYDFGEWESSLNGTAGAIDHIAKDIIICPWHYEKRVAYPSIPMFMGKGFRVLPTSWKNVDAALTLIDYSEANGGPLLLGHLFSTWGRQPALPNYPPLVAGLKRLRATP